MSSPFACCSPRAVLLVLWLPMLLWACGKPPQTAESSPAPTTSAGQRAANSPLRDLSMDEARGGHTLKRHVGRTDQDLRERLTGEQIAAASTYTDRAAAETAIAAALDQNRDRIERWLQRTGSRPNLVLEYDSDRPLGRTLHRGEAQSQPCSHALVVLKWDGPGQYHVLTSYPECR